MRAGLIRLRIARLRRRHDRQTQFGGRGGNDPIAVGLGNRGQGIAGGPGRAEIVGIIAGGAEVDFALLIPGFEVIVGEGLIFADAIAGAHLEIGRQQSDHAAQPMPGRAADGAQVGGAEQLRAGLNGVPVFE